MGWAQATIAAALDVTEAAVSQWIKTARTNGPGALGSKSRQGQGARLSDREFGQYSASEVRLFDLLFLRLWAPLVP